MKGPYNCSLECVSPSSVVCVCGVAGPAKQFWLSVGTRSQLPVGRWELGEALGQTEKEAWAGS